MAHIDNLIEKIADPDLRRRIAEQVAELTDQKSFGLVFQDHLPEAIEVPGIRPRRGDIVRLRADFGKQNYSVTSTRDGKLSICLATAAGDPNPDSPILVSRSTDVVVVKDFTQPIYPGLTETDSVLHGGEKPAHVVIKGENYYVLETLLFTHEGRIDVIYIDPPYNTGASEWIYNDRYVDGNDAYRHSKWLAFMKRRLQHAKRLLSATGVIIIAIDDTEQARLKLLADDIFGESNFIMNVAWQGGAKNDVRFNGGGLDYMLVYAKSVEALVEADAKWRVPKEGLSDVLAAGASAWEESGHNSEIASRILSNWWGKNKARYEPGLGDNVKIDTDGTVIKVGDLSSASKSTGFYDVLHPDTGLAVPRPSRGWAFSPDSMAEMIASGRVLFGKDHTQSVRKKTPLAEMSVRSVIPSFYRDRRGASVALENVLGSKDFPFPKDTDVIAKWIQIVSSGKRDAVVLDFFAGTGTTAEAVMRLNAADGGTRQSIIATNNELAAGASKKLHRAGHAPGDAEWESEGVYDKVTKPRLTTVVTGRRADGTEFSGGLDENVRFFDLTYEDENFIALGKRFRAIAPLLWLKAGATGPVIDEIEAEKGWAISESCAYGVLFDGARARAFGEAVAKVGPSLRNVFVVTESSAAFTAALAQLPGGGNGIKSTRLYGDFLSTFEINGKD